MIATLIGIQLTHLLAVISPGPSFIIVTRVSITTSRAAGVWTALGFAIGTFIYGCAALFGLQSLFAAFPMVYATVRIIAAIYLAYIAFMLWRHAADPLPMPDPDKPHGERPLTSIKRGLLTQLSNPKVVVFMGSIFVTLLPPNPSAGLIAILLAIVVVNEFGWYALVACAVSRPGPRRAYARLKSAIDRTTGAVLAGLGVKLIVAP
jgi:threonine/homoserine/homoserine lactone efflux protein